MWPAFLMYVVQLMGIYVPFKGSGTLRAGTAVEAIQPSIVQAVCDAEKQCISICIRSGSNLNRVSSTTRRTLADIVETNTGNSYILGNIFAKKRMLKSGQRSQTSDKDDVALAHQTLTKADRLMIPKCNELWTFRSIRDLSSKAKVC